MSDKSSYGWYALTAWFSQLTLTTQDVIALIGLVVSGSFTVWTFFSNRREQRKRTRILQNLSAKLIAGSAPPATIKAVAKIMNTEIPTTVKEVVENESESGR